MIRRPRRQPPPDQGLLFGDLAGEPSPWKSQKPEPGPPEPDPEPSPEARRIRLASTIAWPKSVFSIECQLPESVVRLFPLLAEELRHAIRSAEDWLLFVDLVYEGHDEWPLQVHSDVVRALAAIRAQIRPSVLALADTGSGHGYEAAQLVVVPPDPEPEPVPPPARPIGLIYELGPSLVVTDARDPSRSTVFAARETADVAAWAEAEGWELPQLHRDIHDPVKPGRWLVDLSDLPGKRKRYAEGRP